MIKVTRGMLGGILILVGVIVGALGQTAFPYGSTTSRCDNGVCTTTTTVTPLGNYVSGLIAGAIEVLGVVLAYMAARPRFKMMFP
jgi:uncharacterized membrane protein